MTRVKIKESKRGKTQTDYSASFEVLHRAYRTTATEMLWIYSINSCTAYTEIKPHALFKPNCMFQTLFDSRLLVKGRKVISPKKATKCIRSHS